MKTLQHVGHTRAERAFNGVALKIIKEENYDKKGNGYPSRKWA